MTREEAIENIRILFAYKIDKMWRYTMEVAVEALKEPPRVHAHWVTSCGESVEMRDGCPTQSAFCSNCGEWLTASDEYGCCGHYCPNCGAIMDEVK